MAGVQVHVGVIVHVCTFLDCTGFHMIKDMQSKEQNSCRHAGFHSTEITNCNIFAL